MTHPPLLFTHTSEYPCSAQELYDWHSREGALERLLPPWEKVEVLEKSGGVEAGARVHLRFHSGPFKLFPLEFHALHLENNPGHSFHDIQQRGPFSSWSHQHFFSESGDGCRLEDRVEYRLPLQRIMIGPLRRTIQHSLDRMFRHREEQLRNDILLHQRCSGRPLRILISGAGGVLGRELLPLLTTGGHEVWRLVRHRANPARREIRWDIDNNDLDLSGAPLFDGVIHLAGEYIGLHRWTEKKKRRVLESRVRGTRLLVERLGCLQQRPPVFISASATGCYGNCGAISADETHPFGADFISRVCHDWEKEALAAEAAGMRTVMMRFGVGLTPKGGALQRIADASFCGCIRALGKGDQILSWVSIDDMAASLLHALTCPGLSGPVNVVAPKPVSNREFLRTFARVTGRPLLFPLPAPLLRMTFGELADEMLLSGCRVSCEKLVESGFTFRHPELESALRAMYGRWK
ncbi:TIGR01777 family oxidoreductase [Desulforhopalus vacuolatus]|uniref:TIGR01777 family oxidoreductase n=1 Tax=Desulforhopalus vacuolatus TaxID=40414 RepID=UPI001964E303|nr:TIGR01777 family oxidoreductase [Desulforhopalus vacuolatus]MBM9519551.1 TIGR01777 family oxidoreductase [Desulforhopalus vacuolatus]